MSVNWAAFRDAFGSADGTGELMYSIAAGDERDKVSAWGELISRVLHGGTIYPATIPVTEWVIGGIEAGGFLSGRLPVGAVAGTRDTVSERVMAFGFLSEVGNAAAMAIAEPAEECVSAGCGQEEYVALAKQLMDVLRRSRDIFEHGLDDPDEEVQVACAGVLEAIG